MSNIRGPEITERRGNLSFTHYNLPRLGILAKGDLDEFTMLDDVMDLAARQLYHRYQIQARLKVKDMPFLMGQHIYYDSEKLRECVIEPAIKHGTLSIGFIGLAECLTALIGQHHGESLRLKI